MKTMKPIFSTLLASSLCLSLLSACSSSTSDSESVDADSHGFWERSHYGDVIHIKTDGATIYQYTQTTCLTIETLDVAETEELLAEITLDSANDQLLLPVYGNDFEISYQRQSQLAMSCEDNLIDKVTPTIVFEHFWQTYHDYYAFFSERHVDWDAVYAEHVTQVHDAMSDEELFELFASMLSGLDDAHVRLISDEAVYAPEFIKGANLVIEDSFAEQDDYDDIQDYAEALSQRYSDNLFAYLDEDSIEVFDGAVPANVIWGTIEQNTGYLYLANMAYFSEVDEGLNQAENLAVADEVIQAALEDLQHTDAMIIDVRNNNGGHDALSFAIASYFADTQRQVASKNARSYAGESNNLSVSLEPSAQLNYLNPVVIIAGPHTVSAAEVFVMSMQTFPQTRLIGENTNGSFSDVLEKALPNGWKIWLANEVYRDAEGINYEALGLPPEETAILFDLDAIDAGYDPGIETALSTLAE